jgi:hypothetical protein
MEPWYIVIGLLASTGVLFLFSALTSRWVRARRLLARAPRVAIADARDGQVVKVVGTLECAEEAPLEAPISAHPCVRCEARVYRDLGETLEILAEEHLGQGTAWVVDQTGKALIQLHESRVVLRSQTSDVEGEAISRRVGELLERHGGKPREAVSLRFQEARLSPGDRVAVYGRCRFEPDPDPRAPRSTYRRYPARLTIVAPRRGTEALVTNDPALIRDALE